MVLIESEFESHGTLDFFSGDLVSWFDPVPFFIGYIENQEHTELIEAYALVFNGVFHSLAGWLWTVF